MYGSIFYGSDVNILMSVHKGYESIVIVKNVRCIGSSFLLFVYESVLEFRVYAEHRVVAGIKLKANQQNKQARVG